MTMVGLIAIALFFVLYLFFNLTAVGQSLENEWAWNYEVSDTVGYWLRQHDLPPLSYDRATIVVGTLLAISVAAARRKWRLAVWVAVAIPGAVLASEGFKRIFDRPLLVASRDDSVSYPSGHAVVVLVIAAALLIVIPRSWTRWVAPVVGVWMALATSAIVVIGNHRPSEIIGAALLVITVLSWTGAAAHLGLRNQPASAVPPPAGALDAPTADASPGAWRVLALVVMVVIAGLVAAWGALPWVTAIDGLTGAAASLLVLRIGFLFRSWVGDLQRGASRDGDEKATGTVNAGAPSA